MSCWDVMGYSPGNCASSGYFSWHLGRFSDVFSALEDLNTTLLQAMDSTKRVSIGSMYPFFIRILFSTFPIHSFRFPHSHSTILHSLVMLLSTSFPYFHESIAFTFLSIKERKEYNSTDKLAKLTESFCISPPQKDGSLSQPHLVLIQWVKGLKLRTLRSQVLTYLNCKANTRLLIKQDHINFSMTFQRVPDLMV